MEKSLIKLSAQLTLLAAGVWVVSRALGGHGHKKHKTGPQDEKFVQASRVWDVSPLTAGFCQSTFQSMRSALVSD